MLSLAWCQDKFDTVSACAFEKPSELFNNASTSSEPRALELIVSVSSSLSSWLFWFQLIFFSLYSLHQSRHWLQCLNLWFHLLSTVLSLHSLSPLYLPQLLELWFQFSLANQLQSCWCLPSLMNSPISKGSKAFISLSSLTFSLLSQLLKLSLQLLPSCTIYFERVCLTKWTICLYLSFDLSFF